jgi:hypothetical protein
MERGSVRNMTTSNLLGRKLNTMKEEAEILLHINTEGDLEPNIRKFKFISNPKCSTKS